MTIDELKKAALEEETIDVYSSGEGTLLPRGWHTAWVMMIDTSVPEVMAKVDGAIIVTVRGEKRIQQEVRFTQKEGIDRAFKEFKRDTFFDTYS